MDTATFENQLNRIVEAFNDRPKTMLMVEVETGVMRSNITRYVAHLRKQNRVTMTHQGICPISKHKAGFYSTDSSLIPRPGQAELFKPENH